MRSDSAVDNRVVGYVSIVSNLEGAVLYLPKHDVAVHYNCSGTYEPQKARVIRDKRELGDIVIQILERKGTEDVREIEFDRIQEDCLIEGILEGKDVFALSLVKIAVKRLNEKYSPLWGNLKEAA